MKCFLVGCDVFSREIMAAVAQSPHKVTVRFLPYGLHQQGGAVIRDTIQSAIKEAPANCEAVLLAYSLCNNGLVGLRADRIPIVAFRSHDCIACLLGSPDRYNEEHTRTPGTYWLSIGWIEQANDYSQGMTTRPEVPPPNDPTWLKMLEKYGEDNALFLWEEARKQTQNYQRLAYIDTGLGPQDAMGEEARRRAEAMALRFERLTGDRGWIETLVTGPWDSKRFVVVPPGHRIAATYDAAIMAAEPSPPNSIP